MRQTRTNRKNNGTTEPPKDPKNKNPEYIYYAIIALLLIILIGIAVFIFSNRDTATDDNGAFDSEEMTDSENEEDGMIIEESDDEDETDETDEAEEDEAEETDSETLDEDDSEDEAATDETEETDADSDENDESEVSVNDDAPLDESYVPNYNNGSADRNAIAGLVSSVTGLDQSSMITWRVGNNGPGRVFAVMSDSSQNDVYRTFLQYGDGEWHVTAYEQLPEVPAEFR
ncbi:hypothetical protein GCM10008929_07290 [Alkalibacterium psychrotolerans]